VGKRYSSDEVMELTGRSAEEWRALSVPAQTYWVTTSDMSSWEEWDGIGQPALRIGMIQAEFEQLTAGRTSLSRLAMLRSDGDAKQGWFVYQTAALTEAIASAQTWESLAPGCMPGVDQHVTLRFERVL
jgi:hypothetical protein